MPHRNYVVQVWKRGSKGDEFPRGFLPARPERSDRKWELVKDIEKAKTCSTRRDARTLAQNYLTYLRSYHSNRLPETIIIKVPLRS